MYVIQLGGLFQWAVRQSSEVSLLLLIVRLSYGAELAACGSLLDAAIFSRSGGNSEIGVGNKRMLTPSIQKNTYKQEHISIYKTMVLRNITHVLVFV